MIIQPSACTFGTGTIAEPSSSSKSDSVFEDGAALAVMSDDVLLWKKNRLVVKIEDERMFKTYVGMTKDKFLECANRWSGSREFEYIPKFEFGKKNFDIIVRFNSK